MSVRKCVQFVLAVSGLMISTIVPNSSSAIDGCRTNNPDRIDCSSLEVTGLCQDGVAVFTILNTGVAGEGDMIQPTQYRIDQNGSLADMGSILLKGGETMTVSFAGGGSVKIEADQQIGHPGSSHPTVALTCGGGTGVVTATPTPTATSTASNTPLYTPTATPTYTPTYIPTSTATHTPIISATAFPSVTATATQTSTETASPGQTPTPTVTSTNTPTVINTPAASPTNTPTITPTVGIACIESDLSPDLSALRKASSAQRVHNRKFLVLVPSTASACRKGYLKKNDAYYRQLLTDIAKIDSAVLQCPAGVCSLSTANETTLRSYRKYVDQIFKLSKTLQACVPAAPSGGKCTRSIAECTKYRKDNLYLQRSLRQYALHLKNANLKSSKKVPGTTCRQ